MSEGAANFKATRQKMAIVLKNALEEIIYNIYNNSCVNYLHLSAVCFQCQGSDSIFSRIT